MSRVNAAAIEAAEHYADGGHPFSDVVRGHLSIGDAYERMAGVPGLPFDEREAYQRSADGAFREAVEAFVTCISDEDQGGTAA